MATQPDTQPVPTPALSLNNLREIANPQPASDAPVAVWMEFGYLNAMFDAVVQDAGEQLDVKLHTYDLVYWIKDILNYENCSDWMTIEWDEDAIHTLNEIARKAMDGNPDMFFGSSLHF